MAERIRKISEEDFPEVSRLFNYSKSIEELKWLFRDPANPSNYNALVALNDSDKLVGTIGYVISLYKQNDKEIIGVVPMSWRILSDHKGFTGVMLMKKVLEMGDFVFTIGGTDTALSLFPLFKLKYQISGFKYFKIFNIWKFFNSSEDGYVKKTLKTIVLLPAYFKRIKKKNIYGDLKLIEYNPDNFVNDLLIDNDFHKPISKEYLSWLLQCPTIRTYAFYIKKGEKNLGVCVFYIKDVKDTARGRIVYLPFLGKDIKLWRSVLYKSFEFFKTQKCCCTTSIATNNIWRTGYDSGMFKFIKSRPIHLNDTKLKLKDIDIQNWNIQYTEGDSAFVKI